MNNLFLTKEDLIALLEDKEKSLQMFEDFLDDKVDIEATQDALNVLFDIVAKFGVEKDSNGQEIATPLAQKVIQKAEALVQNAENAVSNKRISSLNSDANQIKFDLITLSIYQEMGLVDKSLSANDLRPAEVSEIISRIDLNTKERREYSSLFVDAIMDDKALFECVPPRILADAYIEVKKLIATTNSKKKKDLLLKRFATLASRIDSLILDFSNELNYFYADSSNIADLYHGYQYMMKVRSADLKEQENQSKKTKQHNQQVKEAIEDNNSKLNSFLKEYDELWNLDKLTPENAEQVNKRWEEIKELLANETVSDDVLAACAKYQFLDENKQPIPQFLDSDGKQQLDFKPGYTLNPESRLAQIISLARHDVCMQNVGNLDSGNDGLVEEFHERVPWKFAEISMASQPIQEAIDTPLTQKYVDELWDNIEKNGADVSEETYQAFLDEEVNKTAGFAERLGDKIGTNASVLGRVFEPIENIDKLAKTRIEKDGASGRKQKIGVFKRILKTFGSAMAVSAGLTFVGKATGIAWAGAAIGTTLGIGHMVRQGLKWRKEQKRQGLSASMKRFFSDKRNWGPAVTTGLSSAAFICMATGNPELAAALGIGAITVGTSTNVANIYQDAINAGYSKGQAIAAAVAIGASGIAGAATGNLLMNSLVNYVNNHTDSTLFKDKHVIEGRTETVTHPGQRVYADGVIENNQRILNMWENPDTLQARMDALMNQGLSHDDAVRYLMAFHDATDHNLGNGYFQQIGMNPSDLSALRNSISGTEVQLTPESLRAFEHFNPHISATNTVGYVHGAAISHDLPANAAFDSQGNIVAGNDFFSTYVNNDAPIFEVTPPVTETIVTDPQTIFTPHELAFPTVGMFGTYEPKVIPNGYTERLGARAGALADRMSSIRKTKSRDPQPTNDENEVPDTQPEKDTGIDHDEPQQIDTGAEDRDSETQTNKSKKLFGHGFFHQAKEIIYKTMQATYHGLQKIQKGVQKMSIDHEKYKTQLEEEKTKRIVAENKRKIAQLQLDIDKLQKKLEAKIKREKLANNARRNEEQSQLDHEVLLNLKKLSAEVEKAKILSESGKDLKTAKKIELELSKLEEKLQEQEGRNSVAFGVGKNKKKEEGRQDVRKIRAEGNREVAAIEVDTAAKKADIVAKMAEGIRNLFKGPFRVNKHDVEAASYKLKLEEIKEGIEKLRAQKKESKLTQAQYNAAIAQLIKLSVKKLPKEDQEKLQKIIAEWAQRDL